jgi:hypothetical protein
MARLVRMAMAIGGIGALAFVAGCSSGDDSTSDRTASGGSKSRAATTTTADDLFGDVDPAADEVLDISACDVVLEEDMHAITTYPNTTATAKLTKDEPPVADDVVKQHLSTCVYTVETTTARSDGGTMVSGGSGSVAYVTVSNELRAFAPDPSWPEYEAVDDVGNDAYWTDGGWTLVVLQKPYVVEFQVSIGLDLELFPDVVEGRREMALDLAALVLPRL